MAKKGISGIYHVADRGFVGFAAGVDAVLGDGLADEHFSAVDDAAACGGGFFEESRFARGVDGVEGGHVGFEPFCRQGRCVHIGGHADAGAVDDDIGVERGQRLEACTAAAVFFGQVSGLAFGAVIDGHFGAGIDQPGHDCPRDSAGPDDGGLLAVELVAFDAECLRQGVHRPDVVGVIGGNDSITSDFERIGGPDGHGQRLDVFALAADIVDRVGLVGDGDAEAGEVHPRPAEHVVEECVQPLAFILHPEGQIQGVEVVFGKAGVEDGRAERVADRVADDAEDIGAGVDAVPAEGLAEFADRPLAGRGGLLVVECGEGQEGTELFGQDAADGTGRTHREGDGVGVLVLEQVEGGKAIVDVSGGVDELGDCLRASRADGFVQQRQVVEGALELVGRQNQPGLGAGGQGCENGRFGGAGEVGEFAIDEFDAGGDGFDEDFGSDFLRPGADAAFGHVPTGQDGRQVGLAGGREDGGDGFGGQVVEIIDPQFEHLGAGLGGLGEPLLELR